MDSLQKKREEIVLRTRDDALDKLRKYHKAFIIRPTGFGKTWINVDIATSEINVNGIKKWKKVIFVAPYRSILEGIKSKYEDKLRGVNCVYLTYSALARLYDIFMKQGIHCRSISIFEDAEEGLFIFDEVHRIGKKTNSSGKMTGCNKSSKAVMKLMKDFPNAYYMGTTATPYRTDGGEAGYSFFGGDAFVYPYTINDAFSDKFYNVPLYVVGQLDAVEKYTEEASDKIKKSKSLSKKARKDKMEELKSFSITWAELANRPSVIRRGIEASGLKKDYYRFIVFFPQIKALNVQKENVISWFSEAFKGFNIRSTVLVSTSIEDDDEVEDTELYNLDTPKGTVDIIFNVNKLLEGYHDKNITGVMLLRLTSSDTLYRQAMGRVFDMEMNHRCIIYDIVGNYDVKTGNVGYSSRKSLLDSKNKADMYDEYVGSLNRKVVEVLDTTEDIRNSIRLFDVDREQQERVLVWNFKLGRLPVEVCASELQMDEVTFAEVVKRHKDITGKERQEEL